MRRRLRKLVWMTLVMACLGRAPEVRADTVRVAVAANFSLTLQKLARAFEGATGHRVLPSAASTGQLYAQIRAGAPFDVFLSADSRRPAMLEKDGLARAGSRVVYARGKLALWSRKAGAVQQGAHLLESASLGTIALPDPRTAPYGSAARSFLQSRGLWKPLEGQGRIAVSTSVTHTYQFVATGAADVGFVALSQVLNGGERGSYWVVPTRAGALDQEAVLLRGAKNEVAARAWLRFLTSDSRAHAIIEEDGYEAP